jgi:hypothetical protein
MPSTTSTGTTTTTTTGTTTTTSTGTASIGTSKGITSITTANHSWTVFERALLQCVDPEQADLGLCSSLAELTSPNQCENVVGGEGHGFEPGQDVECRYGGGGGWYAGQVRNVNGDGSFVVQYADGDREERVNGFRMRMRSQKQRWRLRRLEQVDVELRWGAQVTYYPGFVRRVCDDGSSGNRARDSYDILFEDGDEREAVHREHILARCGTEDDLRLTGGRGGCLAPLAQPKPRAARTASENECLAPAGDYEADVMFLGGDIMRNCCFDVAPRKCRS